MLRVGVELPVAFVSAGEFLADVQAYEAARADAIWLGAPGLERPALEPLTLLAAAATVTARVRLGAPATAGLWPVGLLAGVVTTIQHLSRGRLVLGVEGGATGVGDVVGTLRSAGARVLVCGRELDEETLRRAAHLGDGFLSRAAGAGEVAAQFQRVRELRPAPSGGDEFELWARVPAPGGRAEWRELHAAYEGAGATGVIVTHAPNLLDILRNPEDDDRQDLAMAVG